MITLERTLLRAARALPGIAVAALVACATTSSDVPPSAPEALVINAQTTVDNFLRDPNQTWVQQNIGRAKAVLIAPSLVKAGFIFGGSGGRAVLVARDGRTWVGPAFYDLATASVGFQAGIEVSEALILVMTDKAFNSLLSTSFKIGGDASIAAGPVGAGAKSDVTADFIAFTRAKGLYGGVNLDGTVVHANSAWNDAYYNGKQILPPDVLIRKSVRNPKASALIAQFDKAVK